MDVVYEGMLAETVRIPGAGGDEIVIGRHHLHFVDVPAISGMRYGRTSENGASTLT